MFVVVMSEKLVPFSQNHVLHGLIMSLGFAVSLKLLMPKTEWSTVLSFSSLIGSVLLALMESFGHPAIFEKFL